MGEFRMPALGADMTAGKLVEWSVAPGAKVKRGDIIAVVGTDKADIEVEVYESGVVEQLIAKPGETLPVGAVLAVIRGEGEAVTAPVAPAVSRLRASPLAKKLAKERGVDLETIQGTGPGGAIEREDVERAAKAKETKKVAGTGMRQAIAVAMAKSNREIPHYYLSTQIDMSKALRWLEEWNRQRPVESRVLPAALLLKATAMALTRVPELNGYWVDDKLEVAAEVNLGVAISLRGGGLMIPAIASAQNKSVAETMEALRDVITRARGGRLRSTEVTGGTVTVTNLGDLGVESVFGVIYPPQVALIGFGRIVERPWAEQGMLGVRPVVTATLSADHRATDGHRGAQFLQELSQLLQEADKL